MGSTRSESESDPRPGRDPERPARFSGIISGITGITGITGIRGVRGALLVGLLAVVVAACGGDPGAAADPAGGEGPRSIPYRVVATTGMVADIVRVVGGDRADVRGLIGEGVDPHLYRPTRDDVAALQSADIVFYSGLLLEGRMSDTLVRIARKGKPVHAVTEEIPEEYLLEPAESAGHADPHVWMDPSAWKQAVAVVADALAQFDSEGAAAYRERARAYGEELDALDAWAREALASIPVERRVLVTAHDAFSYFGRAYELEVRGIQGLSTESEAGLQDINRLVDLIVDRGIRAVFVETSVASKNVRALIEGARSRGHEVVIGGELFSDAMGPRGTYTGTYLGMLDHNVTTVVRALGGEVDPAGRLGRLVPE